MQLGSDRCSAAAAPRRCFVPVGLAVCRASTSPRAFSTVEVVRVCDQGDCEVRVRTSRNAVPTWLRSPAATADSSRPSRTCRAWQGWEMDSQRLHLRAARGCIPTWAGLNPKSHLPAVLGIQAVVAGACACQVVRKRAPIAQPPCRRHPARRQLTLRCVCSGLQHMQHASLPVSERRDQCTWTATR